MVATIARFFQDGKRASIIAEDRAGTERKCFVWLDSPKQEWIASLCKESSHPWLRPKPTLVLTLAPPNLHGWHEVEDAELMEPVKEAV